MEKWRTGEGKFPCTSLEGIDIDQLSVSSCIFEIKLFYLGEWGSQIDMRHSGISIQNLIHCGGGHRLAIALHTTLCKNSCVDGGESGEGRLLSHSRVILEMEIILCVVSDVVTIDGIELEYFLKFTQNVTRFTLKKIPYFARKSSFLAKITSGVICERLVELLTFVDIILADCN